MPGFQSFLAFLLYFALAKLATSDIKVNNILYYDDFKGANPSSTSSIIFKQS